MPFKLPILEAQTIFLSACMYLHNLASARDYASCESEIVYQVLIWQDQQITKCLKGSIILLMMSKITFCQIQCLASWQQTHYNQCVHHYPGQFHVLSHPGDNPASQTVRRLVGAHPV
ncbi:hypothetical protein V8G54_029148 [Vigna mungo]|uniref:Uncharacterized protein n=1 Tax=Vigna mungo TaxID=3915 RepID=A0AAQ3MTK5_VIGMU